MPLPSWTEVRVAVPIGWEELVAQELAAHTGVGAAHGPSSLADEAAPDGASWVRGFLSQLDDTPAARAALVSTLGDLTERTSASELTRLTPTFRVLPPEDWATSWQKTWKPFRVGRLAVVRPDTPASLRRDDLRLVLEPGGVFGTGRHASTRACLELLQLHPPRGQRVLDAGTGTGILAVAAALLGASEVHAFDLDPGSPAEATKLASNNGVAGSCDFRLGGFELLDEWRGPYELVVANIYADIIQAQAAALAARLTPSGRFLFSGISAKRLPPTLAALEAAGLHPDHRRQRGRWCTITGRAHEA